MLKDQPRVFWWAVVSAALMIVGSFGPWARAFIVTVSGVDGDGWLVIFAALAALGVLYLGVTRPRLRRLSIVVCALAGAAGLAVVIYDGNDIFGDQSSGDEDDLFGGADLVTPGWGIWMAGLASASLILASVALYVRRWWEGAPATPPPMIGSEDSSAGAQPRNRGG
jgi:hypothetical protein